MTNYEKLKEILEGSLMTGSRAFGLPEFNDTDYVVDISVMQDVRDLISAMNVDCLPSDYLNGIKFKLDNELINVFVVAGCELVYWETATQIMSHMYKSGYYFGITEKGMRCGVFEGLRSLLKLAHDINEPFNKKTITRCIF